MVIQAEQNKESLIPRGWEHCLLGDLIERISNGANTQQHEEKVGLPISRIETIWNGEIDWQRVKYIQEDFSEFIEKYKLRPGDILLSHINSDAHLGKTAIFCDKNRILIHGINLLLIRLNHSIDHKFINFQLRNLRAKGRFVSIAQRAVNQSSINQQKIKGLEICLPPLAEQHRIVDKIEELFSDLDDGIASLKKAQQQLKMYRQAVLKWAFEGKLTNKYVKGGELPKGWEWKTIKEITSVLGDGLHGTPKYSDDGDYFFINGNNLSDGKIEIKVNTKRVSQTEFEKYKKPLNNKTVLVSINGTLGNTAFYTNEKVILGKSACYFNVLENIDKRYVRHYITSHRFVNYANKNATGSTIKNVGLKAMREFEMPMPPTLSEQNQIVEEIESRLSICDRLEATIAENLQRAEALRQSILKQAFEGKLVPQDPNDEPASVLLERIRQEQAKGKGGIPNG